METMIIQKLTADIRKITGRKVKILRRDGLIPANVFGKDVKSYAIQVSEADFKKVYQEVGETGVVELSVDKKTAPVLISNVSVHPVTDKIIHVDFRQIDLTKKVTAMVPVKVVGEAAAEKSGIGTVVQQTNELQVEALPTDLPESFEVDVTALEDVDAAIYVRDLKYDKEKLVITDVESDQIVVKVEPPQKEEEVAAPPLVEGEVAAEETPEAKEASEQKEAAPGEEPKEE